MIERRWQHTNPTIQISLHHTKRHTRLKPPKNGNSLSKITITDKDIKEVIDDMAIVPAPGPDGITASISKKYADQLIYPRKKK